jgi:outer membrane protein
LAARAALRAVDEGVPQALSNWRPDVALTGSSGVSQITNTRETGSNVDQTRHPMRYALEVTQPLFLGGRTVAATAQADHEVLAERARLVATEQAVFLDTATAFMNVFRDHDVLKLNINNEHVLRRQLEATRDRFKVGEITRTDVHQAEARLARAVADRIEAEGALNISRANYANVVGSVPPGELTLPPFLTDLPESKQQALEIALRGNPAVISAEFDRRAARDNTDNVRGELLPSVGLSGILSRDRESSAECCRASSFAVILNVTIPLYQKGAVSSRLRQARQIAAQKALLIDQERRNAIETASASWDALVSAQARVRAFTTQIDASAIALDGVQREAEVGSRTVLDVLDAEQELLDSRVAHIRAQRDETVAAYQLLSSTGRLTAENLKLSLSLYDPQKHYDDVRQKWFGGSAPKDIE